MVLRSIYLITRDREASEELTQEVFIRAYRRQHHFRGDASERTWLYRIACNIAKNHLRRRPEQRGRAQIIDFDSRATTHPGPEEIAAHEDTRSSVLGSVSELPAELREVVALYYLEEMSVRQVSEVVGVPAGTVKSRLSRARAELRKALGENEAVAGREHE